MLSNYLIHVVLLASCGILITSFDPSAPVDIELAIGVERGTKFAHWMLQLRHRHAPTGTWYDSTGGPSLIVHTSLKFRAAEEAIVEEYRV